MNKQLRRLSLAIIVSLLGHTPLLAFADVPPLDGSVPTSQPANATAAESPQQLVAQFTLTTDQLKRLIPPNVLSNDDKRAEFAPQAIPILYRRLELVDQLAAVKLIAPIMVVRKKAEGQSLLYLLEDQATVRRVNSMVESGDPARKLAGQLIAVNAHWLGAGFDSTRQNKAADEIETLDRAHPTELRLTQLTLSMADESRSPEVESRLLHLVLDVMTDPLARVQKPGVKQQLDAQATQQKFVNQPIVIAGTTIDGNDFSTSHWKGKVVVVDFWATWCGPCKAEFPHLIEIYEAYHSKGLEMVGVSSDETAKPLRDFLTQSALPWPQLFDPKTAALRLHPICAQFAITGLPTTYIIDKQGILRSVAGSRQMDEMIPALLAERDPTTKNGDQ